MMAALESSMDALRNSILLAILFIVLMADSSAAVLSSAKGESPPNSGEAGKVVRLDAGPGITLSGVLTFPSGDGPHPAVVLLSGLGKGDQALTECLTNAGVAVLTFDTRGSGESTGTFRSWMPEITADDALAWIHWLATQPGIDPKRIGVIGHSQGGVAGAIAAGREPDRTAFVVLLAAVGVPMEECQLQQMVDRGRAIGLEDAVVTKFVELQRDLYRHVVRAKDNAAAMKIARETVTQHLAGFTPEERQQLQLDEGAIDEMVRRTGEPWFREFLAFDPRPTFRTVKCPVLALHGSGGLQVAAKANLESIATDLKAGGNLRVKTVELPGLDHEFRDRPFLLIRKTRDDSPPFDPAALTIVSDWIREQTRR